MRIDDRQFSPREKEVLELLLQGKSNKQIALALGISVSTVEFHLKNIFGKLQVRSRAEAVFQLRESTGGDQTNPLGESIDGAAEQQRESIVDGKGVRVENDRNTIPARRILMKKWFFIIGGSLLLAIVLAAAVLLARLPANNVYIPPAATLEAISQAGSFAGAWTTNVGRVDFQQAGDDLTGSIAGYGGGVNHTFNATVDANGEAPFNTPWFGDFTLVLVGDNFKSKSGDLAFCGIRSDKSEELPAGCGFSGKWIVPARSVFPNGSYMVLKQVGENVTGDLYDGNNKSYDSITGKVKWGKGWWMEGSSTQHGDVTFWINTAETGFEINYGTSNNAEQLCAIRDGQASVYIMSFTCQPSESTSEVSGTAFPLISSYGTSLNLSPGLGNGVVGEVVPQAPQADSELSLWPEHIQLTLQDYPLRGQDASVTGPQILVFPAEKYAQMDACPQATITGLKNILATQLAAFVNPSSCGPTGADSLPFLPDWHAAQFFHAQAKILSFKNGTGIRYITQYSQAAFPIVSNTEMFYTFQGLTRDGAYYVSVILPVNLAALDDIPTPEFGSNATEDANQYTHYLKPMIDRLDLADNPFNPSLASLDALVQSLLIEARP